MRPKPRHRDRQTSDGSDYVDRHNRLSRSRHLGRAGGFAAFVSEPARIALALVGFALGVAALFSQGHVGAGEREDRGNSFTPPT